MLYFSPLSVTDDKQRDRKHPFSFPQCRMSYPKEPPERQSLQPRCTLGAIQRDPQTRDEKWARGSRSQTHRRAAKGGFTQDDGKVERRLASPIADRLVCSFCCSKSSDCSWVLKKLGPWYLVPILTVTVLRVKPIAGEYSREHCPRVYAICRPELG